MDKYESFIGKVLDGRYKILELVGVGGMAFVLKAEDLVMNRIVAIKVLNDQYNNDEQAEKRFINESKAVAMMSNKNIVGIYDVAIYPDIKYIVMEYLDGINLKAYIDKKGLLPWKEASAYMLQVLRALEHAHSKGVIHRDIKPQNILLLSNGEVRVTDFGIAKTPTTPEITVTEKAIGTVYYISPEQAAGKQTTAVSDLYSVGVMFYEAVTGELPFVAESPVTIAMMQINDQPKCPRDINPEIPEGINQIILKAMQKDGSKRFSDAHAMLKAIDYVVKNPETVFNDQEITPGIFGTKTEYIDINMVDTGDIGEYTPDIPRSPETTEDKNKQKKKKPSVRKRIGARIKEKQSHSMFPVISGVFFAFFIVVMAVGGYMLVKWLPLLFSGSDDSKEFVVRQLVGMDYNDALKKDLENNGYLVTVKDGYYPNYDYGAIILQDPASGPRKLTGNLCRITLTINRFPNELTVPNVKYKTRSEAEKLLKQYNLNAVVEYKADNYTIKDQVIGTYPEIGESVESGRTITLYICNGSTTTTAKAVPNVEGLSIEEAIKKLEAAYLSYEIVRVESLKPMNTVIEQSIAPYTTGLAAWTNVVLTVSKQNDYTKVPKLMGKTQSEAEALLTEAGLRLGTVFYDENSVLPIGTVCDQNVADGVEIATDSFIDITISGQKVEYASPVPNVLGKDMYIAEYILKDAGYDVRFNYMVSDAPEDTVVLQSIAEGTAGLKKNTVITITIAEVQTKTKVPDLFGLSLEDAEALLELNNLKCGNVTYDSLSPFPPGLVSAQSFEVDFEVNFGTYVNITISGDDPNFVPEEESSAEESSAEPVSDEA